MALKNNQREGYVRGRTVRETRAILFKSARNTARELICPRAKESIREKKKKRGNKIEAAVSCSLTGIKNQGWPVSKVTRQISNVVSTRKERVESRRNLRTLGDDFNSLSAAFFSVSLCRARTKGRLRFLKLLARFFDFNYSFNIF